MSDPNTITEELKAGHPPAVKVAGGVRITQHKLPHENPPKPDKDDDEEDVEIGGISTLVSKPTIQTICGVSNSGSEQFSNEMKSFHDKKQIPKNECRPKNNFNNMIHQPKK